MCSIDLQSVEISDGAIIKCSHESCVSDQQGPDFDDMAPFFPCNLCYALKYVNPGYELLVTEI
jgi:hypothetical protein